MLSTSNHSELASLAVKTALVERDVAHLIFPDDVQTQPSDARAGTPAGRISAPVVKPSDADVAAAVNMISGAKRPLIIMGHGAWDAKDQIIALPKDLKNITFKV